MIKLFFSCIDDQGEYRDCMYGGPTLEIGLDIVNDLVRNDAQLTFVQLRYYELAAIQLPIEAFDGYSVSDSLRKLEKDWKRALLR